MWFHYVYAESWHKTEEKIRTFPRFLHSPPLQKKRVHVEFAWRLCNNFWTEIILLEPARKRYCWHEFASPHFTNKYLLPSCNNLGRTRSFFLKTLRLFFVKSWKRDRRSGRKRGKSLRISQVSKLRFQLIRKSKYDLLLRNYERSNAWHITWLCMMYHFDTF